MSQLQLLKSRKFWPLFWTQFFGAFNDNFFKNALVILITFKSVQVMGIAPGQMVALSGGIFILPFFLFSATSGQLADKNEKTRIIHIIKLAEIAIMILAAVGFATEQYGFLLAVLFLMGAHSTFFGPIKYSILPQSLEPHELIAGNALIEAGTFLAILLGTIAGGTLILLPSGIWISSAGLIAVAVLGWALSLMIPKAPPVAPELVVQWNPIPPTLQILRATRSNRTVFLSILGISWFWFFGGAVLSLLPTYCKDVLGGTSGMVTLFLAIFSIGIGVGSLLCERLSHGRVELGLVPLGSIGISVFAADLFLATPVPGGPVTRVVIDLLLLSIFSGFFIVPLYTLMQERSDPSLRSRVIAANNIVNAVFMVGSAVALMGLMAAGLSIPQIFLALALLNLLAAAYIYLLLPDFLVRLVVWACTHLIYRLRVLGASHIPREGPAVLVCNHVSFVDWMIIAAGVGRPVRFIMDHAFAGGWITRLLLKQARVILIASLKENPALLKKSFEQAAAELRAGELVCIFPEGVITRDGELQPFRSGVEKILRETPVPVIPMAIQGMWGSWFSRERGRAIKKWPRRYWSRVTLSIGNQRPATEATAAGLQSEVARLLNSPE